MPRIRLPYNYEPRHYQLRLNKYMDAGGKRALCIWHRRAGKDLTFINILAKKSYERVGAYYYYFPTQASARKIIWNGMNRDGFKFLDYFPKDYVKHVNNQEMYIEFINGSIFQIIGTDRLDVVGVNPVGCVFSEYSLQNPKGWQLVQPILRENDGWAIFNGTMRGAANHMTKLYKRVKSSPRWYSEVLTIRDTGAISEEMVEQDIMDGEISRELAMQEYYCDILSSTAGAYYSTYLNQAEKEGRICDVPVNPLHPVYTGWDLGIDNAMGIWFFQIYDKNIYFLAYYEKTNEGLRHYMTELERRGYHYARHFAPWDVSRRDLASGLTLHENARKMGLDFDKVKRTSRVTDDIELCRCRFPRAYFDQRGCEFGLEALGSYHQKQDEKRSMEGRPVFTNSPEHDWSSNCADSFRTVMRAWDLGMCKLRPGMFAAKGKSKPLQTNYLGKKGEDIPLHMQKRGNSSWGKEYDEEMEDETKEYQEKY